jgi:gamma-glutamylcyclotransferase (GGCT)/AIG2-like uncharacterized protein YtfP
MVELVMNKVFVYGTLKSGFGNHRLMESRSTFITKDQIKGLMVSLGGFPGVVHADDRCVKGEVYEVTDDCLKDLDRLEGHPRFYKRTKVTTQNGLEVETYIYQGEIKHRQVVETGDWSNGR